ncbi:granzyme G-like isoform X12 [Ctenopharyngodon idella]|uniref:granzyme G-like isoform X12 n=1 Tax=Ctenopharyngodon idella TaxID=7959 RepID=UPI00222FC911|nr:granzyme G-like isoform X12 [Ctenopharyngodon idella]
MARFTCCYFSKLCALSACLIVPLSSHNDYQILLSELLTPQTERKKTYWKLSVSTHLLCIFIPCLASKSSSIVFFIMTIIISLLLLASLLPHLTFTDHVNVGIMNGTEAKPHSRPYMVSLQKEKNHICGGFLISDQFVLTAAHCQKKNEILTVVVGAHNLKNENEGSVRIGVKSYHKYPGAMNDIMLLQLEKKVKPTKNVNWISLPKKESINKTDPDCSVVGWGRLYMKGPKSDYLMEANVKIMDIATCKKKWGKSYSVSQMICAHGHGGSCKGDSGGPLVCDNTAVGVTSFGDPRRCNSPKYPNVYIKISPYFPWIYAKIRNVK